ncbi:hypothetical protein ACFLYO_11925 [Chloroflexota bacterium]
MGTTTDWQSREAHGITLYYEAAEQEAAALIGAATIQTAELLHDTWGLATPANCRVYVMTDWPPFLFHAVGEPRRTLYRITMPLWRRRVDRMWPLVGGWSLFMRGMSVATIKAPRLLATADTSIGQHLFIKETDLDIRACHITAHELTHAFTTHLRLPVWLHEGLAMSMVDKLLGHVTVQPATLGLLANPPDKIPTSYRRLDVRNVETAVFVYARGYWLTRYLLETRPELLRELLARRYRHREIETQIADVVGIDRKNFWPTLTPVLNAHFADSSA